MRLSILFFGLSFLATKVVASRQAAPYETVLFYYAYRMDTIERPGVYSIGRDCPGTGEKGVCFFDEFVKWITSRDANWRGSTRVGKNLDPDVSMAADQLYGAHFMLDYDIHHLYPDKFPAEEGPSHKAVVGAIIDKVQDNLTRDVDNVLKPQFDNLMLAFRYAQIARIGDMLAYTKKDLNEELKKKAADWKAKTFRMPVGDYPYPVEVVDIIETLEEHPEMTREFKFAMMEMVNGYATSSGNGSKHYRILQEFASFYQRLVKTCE